MSSKNFKEDDLIFKLEEWKRREQKMRELFPAKVLDAISIKRDKLIFYTELLHNPNYQQSQNRMFLNGIASEAKELRRAVYPLGKVGEAIYHTSQKTGTIINRKLKSFGNSIVKALDTSASIFLGKRFMHALKSGYQVFRQVQQEMAQTTDPVSASKEHAIIPQANGIPTHKNQLDLAFSQVAVNKSEHLNSAQGMERKISDTENVKNTLNVEAEQKKPKNEIWIQSSFQPTSNEKMDIERKMIRNSGGKLVEKEVVATYSDTVNHVSRKQSFDPMEKFDRHQMYILITGGTIFKKDMLLKLDFTDADAQGNYRIKKMPIDKTAIHAQLKNLPLYNLSNMDALNDLERRVLEQRLFKGDVVSIGLYAKGNIEEMKLSLSSNSRGIEIRDLDGNTVKVWESLANNIQAPIKSENAAKVRNGMSVI